jgi:tetratricopeptide (TPR) repeat protein
MGRPGVQVTEVQVPGFRPDLLERAPLDEALAALSGEAAAAKDSWQRALIFERLGALYRLAGQPEAAARALEAALEAHGERNNPAVTRVYVSLGLALRSAGRPQQALDAWERGIALLMDRALKIIYEEGTLLRAAPDRSDRTLLADPRVFARIRELCRLDLTFAILRNNMGVVHAEHGAIQQAAQMFREALDFTPEGARYEHPRVNLSSLEEHGTYH